MIKFAFLMNMPGETPKTCYGEYNNKESHSRIVGIERDAADEYMKKLVEEGFAIVDLCGDFTDEDLERLTKASSGKIRISRAKFLPAELEKMDKLESLFEYGLIVYMSGVEKTEWVEILNRQGNTYVAFVKDMDSAMAAAGELVKKGVAFMELCSWFDGEKTKKVIDAIAGAAPVGTCGEIK